MGVSRWTKRTATSLLLVMACAACSGAGRPTVSDWEQQWHAVVAGIPSEATLGQTPARSTCDTTLAVLRSTSGDLVPTPDPALDEVVDDWVRLAEDAFFECPPASNQVPDFATAYAELDRLEAEVRAVVEGGDIPQG